MNDQELIPQKALPCLGQDDEGRGYISRNKSNHKLARLVVSAIAFEYGLNDLALHKPIRRRKHEIETSRTYWADLCRAWKEAMLLRIAIKIAEEVGIDNTMHWREYCIGKLREFQKPNNEPLNYESVRHYILERVNVL